MALRNTLEQIPETIQEFELAADNRIDEGKQLISSGYLGVFVKVVARLAAC
jgi:hypothetical protein